MGVDEEGRITVKSEIVSPEAFHSKVLTALSDGVIVTDEQWTIVFANRAMSAIYGYDDGDLPLRSVSALLVDSAQRFKRLTAEMSRVAENEDRWVGELNGMRKDGSRFISRAAVAPLRHDGRRWWVIVQRDVSERKRLERAIVDAVNQEQRRFASELHDGLGQELSGLSLMLASLAPEIAGSPTAAATLAEAQGVLSDAIRSCRTSAEGTAAFMLDRLGLGGGLEMLARRSVQLYGMKCSMQIDPRSGGALDPAVAYELYCITQEAIRNASRHGRADLCIVSLRHLGRGGVELKIQDNGIGFNGRADGQQSGLGLKIMRYRAAQIGALLAIESAPGSGTQISCRMERS